MYILKIERKCKNMTRVITQKSTSKVHFLKACFEWMDEWMNSG